MSFTYRQSTGELFAPTGERIGVGYAGHGEGVNDPAMEAIANVGPLPKGRYVIGPAYTHPTLGPLTMNLTPYASNEMYGREDFRIHGDAIRAAGQASRGCIVQDHPVRVQVNASDDAARVLDVIA